MVSTNPSVRSPGLFVLVIACAVVSATAGIRLTGSGNLTHPDASRFDIRPAAIYRRPYDPEYSLKQVAFYAAGARKDPHGAAIRAMLSTSYLQRCRETGDIADAIRAEQAARQSISLRTNRNEAAFSALAQSLLMQHRFNEALTIATRVDQSRNSGFNLNGPQARYLLAEIHVERGDYLDAARDLESTSGDPETITGTALHARLLEMNGNTAQALQQMKLACKEADEDPNVARENVAWFHMRVGDLLSARGQLSEAERAYRDALELYPHHFLTLTALTRLAACKQDWKAAISWGTRSAEIVPNPEVLALVGDAYSHLGNDRAAQSEYSLIEDIGKISRAQGTLYDRQRALYCADHNRNLDEALRLARRELSIRHDVYAYDTLAWVCCKKGLLAEASLEMNKALSRRTQDARLYYHAGCIAFELKHREEAANYLRTALSINSQFSHSGPTDTRRLLAKLQ